MAKKKQYNKMTVDELQLELKDVKSALFNFRFQKSLQQLEHPQKISHAKKEIAKRKIELGIK